MTGIVNHLGQKHYCGDELHAVKLRTYAAFVLSFSQPRMSLITLSDTSSGSAVAKACHDSGYSFNVLSSLVASLYRA